MIDLNEILFSLDDALTGYEDLNKFHQVYKSFVSGPLPKEITENYF